MLEPAKRQRADHERHEDEGHRRVDRVVEYDLPHLLKALGRGQNLARRRFDLLQRIAGYFNIIWDEAEELFFLAGSSDPKVYLPVLAKTTDYKGVTGNISFDSKGDVKNGALTLYTYKGGKRDQIAVVR